MRRRLLPIAAAFVAVIAAVWFIRNPERQSLTDADRANAAGRSVRLTDGVTRYELAGPDTGVVAVLVHGFSVPAYIWDSTFHALASAGRRVLRYDLFGRGWSDRPKAAYDEEFFVRQLRELLDSLGVADPVDLVGLSYGGLIVPAFAAAHPERVRRIVLVDPVTAPSSTPWYIKAPVIGAYLWQVMVVPGMAEGQAGDFVHPERFPTWAEQYRPQMAFRGFGRALRRSRLTLDRADFAPLYTAIRRGGYPLLLVWGREDQTVDIANATTVQAAIPQTEFFPVDSVGHLPHLEASATVNAQIVAFLAR